MTSIRPIGGQHLHAGVRIDSADADAVYCPHCGYDLRGLVGEACPECGEKIDRATLALPQIPWVHPREIGRVRAFWRTVWRVSFHSRRFCHEAARPVDYPDARRFQRALVVWLLVPLVPFVAAAVLNLRPFGADHTTLTLTTVASAVAAAGLFLFALTGIHTYWLHPRALAVERQNRAVALGYYAGAPLAFLPGAAVWLFVGAMLAGWGN